MEHSGGDVTTLLRAWGAGDRDAESRLFELVLPDLRAIAQNYMRRESPGHSLQPTALVHEAYFRLVGAHERDWQDRRHFFAIAARIMRRLLIDHARGRRNGRAIPLDGLEEMLRGREENFEQALAIDLLLDEMEESHPDWCRIVELRFFLGLTDEQSAEALDLPLRTLQRRYSEARRWLFQKWEGAGCRTKPNTTSW